MVTESYAHVHHIVSNVSGRLRADRSPVDALRAVFPGGTITGCPKVRCMEIIAELEGEGRGAYTGSLGLVGHRWRRGLQHPDPHDDACAATTIELRAGAGIVADSIPERELEETRAKARGLLRAFETPHERRSSATWIDGVRTPHACRRTIAACTMATACSRRICVRAGTCAFLDAHLARLALGLRAAGIRFAAMARVARGDRRGAPHWRRRRPILKIIVTRGSAARRGYAPRGTRRARRVLSLWPTAPTAGGLADGVDAAYRAHCGSAENPALAGIKHLNRLENVLAASRSRGTAAHFDALLLDASRRVISGTMSNVFTVQARHGC